MNEKEKAIEAIKDLLSISLRDEVILKELEESLKNDKVHDQMVLFEKLVENSSKRSLVWMYIARGFGKPREETPSYIG